MQSHHNCSVRFLVHCVEVCHKGNFLKEAREACLLVFLGVALKVVRKLVYVGKPVRCGFGIKHKRIDIAAFLHCVVKQFFERKLLSFEGKVLYHIGKGN